MVVGQDFHFCCESHTLYRGGSRIPRRRGLQSYSGRQHMILPKIPKNCMKLRKVWAMGAVGAVGERGVIRSATALSSVHADLLAIALADIAKNAYFTQFLASLVLTLSLRAQCERALTCVKIKPRTILLYSGHITRNPWSWLRFNQLW